MPDEVTRDTTHPEAETPADAEAKKAELEATVDAAVKKLEEPIKDAFVDAAVGEMQVPPEVLAAAKAAQAARAKEDDFSDVLKEAGILGTVKKADVPVEHMKSFMVAGKDPKTGEMVELIVPRNIPRLIGDLLMSAETYGDAFLDSELDICRFLGQDEATLLKFRLCKGPARRVIAFLKTMVLTPQQAVREVMKLVNGIFEHSTCGIAGFALMFMDTGLTGNIIQNDGLVLGEAEVKMFFNGLHGQATEYGNALEKRGVKVFEPDIIKAPAGFDVSTLKMVGGRKR